MLTEDDVVAAVCDYLTTRHYAIIQKCGTTVKGVDIIATSPSGETLHVEAKGETSNQSKSRRYGKSFNRAQCHVHVAGAFFTAASSATGGADAIRSAMAFPDTRIHREFVGRIHEALTALGIAVFWVSANRVVTQCNPV